MEDICTILTINIVISIIALPLHLIGIYALKMSKKWNNQVIILMNLSVAEIILLINEIINSSIGLKEYDEKYFVHTNNITNHPDKAYTELYLQIYVFTIYVGIPGVTLSLMLLTIDRLICILSPLHYQIVAEERSIFQKMVIGSWLISIISGLLTLSQKTKFVSRMFGFIAVTITIILFFITYILIGFKIRMSRSSLQSSANKSVTDQPIRFKKHHLVPGLIILTFVIFYVTPFTVLLCYGKKITMTKKIYIREILQLCPIVGYISDALIYIFLTKANRDIIVKILPC